MPKYMEVDIETERLITETWRFEIHDGQDPDDLFEEIKNNPNVIWINHDSNLIYSDDIDETTRKVVSYRLDVS